MLSNYWYGNIDHGMSPNLSHCHEEQLYDTIKKKDMYRNEMHHQEHQLSFYVETLAKRRSV